jgi:hypothetical protein
MKSYLRLIEVALTILILSLAISACQNDGYLSRDEAIETAIRHCTKAHSKPIVAPTIIEAVRSPVDSAMTKDWNNDAQVNDVVWLVTMDGQWPHTGGPPPEEGATASSPPVFNRCQVLFDAKTGSFIRLTN